MDKDGVIIHLDTCRESQGPNKESRKPKATPRGARRGFADGDRPEFLSIMYHPALLLALFPGHSQLHDAFYLSASIGSYPAACKGIPESSRNYSFPNVFCGIARCSPGRR